MAELKSICDGLLSPLGIKCTSIINKVTQQQDADEIFPSFTEELLREFCRETPAQPGHVGSIIMVNANTLDTIKTNYGDSNSAQNLANFLKCYTNILIYITYIIKIL